MAENTTNYNLEKATGNEYYEIELHGRNMDKIDAALKENADAVAAAETPAGAQEKADEAETDANAYTDQEVGSVSQALTAHQNETASPHQYEDEGTDPDYTGIKYRLVMVDGKPYMEVVANE